MQAFASILVHAHSIDLCLTCSPSIHPSLTLQILVSWDCVQEKCFGLIWNAKLCSISTTAPHTAEPQQWCLETRTCRPHNQIHTQRQREREEEGAKWVTSRWNWCFVIIITLSTTLSVTHWFRLHFTNWQERMFYHVGLLALCFQDIKLELFTKLLVMPS